MSTYHSSLFITRLSHKVWKHSTNYIFLMRVCLAHCTLLFAKTFWVLLNFIYLLRFPTFSRKNGVSNSGFSSYFFLGLLGMQKVTFQWLLPKFYINDTRKNLCFMNSGQYSLKYKLAASDVFHIFTQSIESFFNSIIVQMPEKRYSSNTQ